jgi:hypothetical protein
VTTLHNLSNSSNRAAARPVLTGGDNQAIAVYLHRKREERAARARPTGALAGLRLEQGAVRSTSQKSAIVAEKLVWPPVEGCAGVDAVVHVSVVLTTP